MTGKYTYFLQVAITPDMREAIRVEAAEVERLPLTLLEE